MDRSAAPCSSAEEKARSQGASDTTDLERKEKRSKKLHHESKSKSRSSTESYSNTKRTDLSPRGRHRSRSPSSRHHHRHSRAPQQQHSRSPTRKRRSVSPRRKHRSRSPTESHGRSAKASGSSELTTYSKPQHSLESAGCESVSDDVSLVDKQLSKEVCEQPEAGKPLTAERRLEVALGAAQALAPKLPAYMNRGAMNPIKFQSVKDKRKLLWSHSKEEPKSFNNWEQVRFGEEEKSQTKFRRLMGIRSNTPQESSTEVKVQDETTAKLEEQYEVSRYLTHIARGAGLGYGSQSAAPVTDYKEKLEEQ